MSDMFARIRCASRDSWLQERRNRIQASESAAIDGTSPWLDITDVFDEKTGMAEPKDISSRPYIQYGVAMEPIAREAFMLDVPYFSLDYHQYDILVSAERPWMGATLDGELTVKDPMNPWGLPVGAKGIYEGKTGSWRREDNLLAWDGTDSYIPSYYYSQCLHQLSVTGWDFVILCARLKREGFRESDMGFPEIRTYYRIVDRRSASVRADIRTLEIEEETFWWEYVKQGLRPARRLAI